MGRIVTIASFTSANMRKSQGGLYRIIFVSPRILPQPPPDWSRITDPTARPETKDWVVAGITGFSYQSMSDLTGSTGLMLFPFARGTGVSTHSCGLTLRWAMTLPASTSDKVNKDGEGPSDEEPIPLGLRRMQWESSPDNSPSVGLAKRMGYKLEGNRRMCLMLREGQAGNSEYFTADGLNLECGE